jgi:hypothetical protein
MSEEIPLVKPQKLKEYDIKQSKYKQVSSLPIRTIILAPSGGGKTILIQNLILDIYKGLWSRIYIFSPSIDVDHSWESVKKYMKEDLKLNETDEEKYFFSEYNPEALMNIIDTQKKISEYQKKNDHKRLYQILIVIDDFADDPSFCRHSKLLHGLFTRGRHAQISSVVATQKFAAISPIIRVNASEIYCFRLRNNQDLEMFLQEISAVADKKTILDMYQMATDEPHSFLYVKLTSKDKSKMFMIRYEKYIQLED